MLNINQSPDTLDEIHGEMDYYWYLRSPAFIKAFIKPLGELVNSFGDVCLDVGCGEGVLFDHVKVTYYGIEGALEAVKKARRDRPTAMVMHGRIEAPPDVLDGSSIGTIVFGGLLSVLVKPECHAKFASLYRRFQPQRFIVYDLERLDTSHLDAAFRRVSEFHAVAEIDGIEDVKKARKILVYEYGK